MSAWHFFESPSLRNEDPDEGSPGLKKRDPVNGHSPSLSLPDPAGPDLGGLRPLITTQKETTQKETTERETTESILLPEAPSAPGRRNGHGHQSSLSLEPEAALLRFPCAGSPAEWVLTRDLINEWRIAYPAVSILEEASRALSWVNANPRKKKKASGMRRFLAGWFGREQKGNRGPFGAGQRPATTPEQHAKGF